MGNRVVATIVSPAHGRDGTDGVGDSQCVLCRPRGSPRHREPLPRPPVRRPKRVAWMPSSSPRARALVAFNVRGHQRPLRLLLRHSRRVSSTRCPRRASSCASARSRAGAAPPPLFDLRLAALATKVAQIRGAADEPTLATEVLDLEANERRVALCHRAQVLRSTAALPRYGAKRRVARLAEGALFRLYPPSALLPCASEYVIGAYGSNAR
eukprot:7469-Pleurochrysis_carterae.AAC.2